MLSDQNQITRVPGRVTLTTALSATGGATTFTEINLAIANLGARVINVADSFMYWRMTNLRYLQVIRVGLSNTGTPVPPGSDVLHACAFTPLSNANFAAAVSTAQMADFAEYSQGNGYHRIGFRVGRSGLIGSQISKWLTTNTTSDSDVQSAGTVTVFTSSVQGSNVTTGSCFSLLEFELEFKSPTDPATVPLAADHKRGLRVEEKDQYFDVKAERIPSPRPLQSRSSSSASVPPVLNGGSRTHTR
jgi:hypothetical protein